MRELIDVLFWYAGFGFWSAMLCVAIYKIHRLFLDKDVKWYILIKNLIQFPFIMLWLRCWGVKRLEQSNKTIQGLRENDKNLERCYFLTRIGFEYVEYRYARIRK